MGLQDPIWLSHVCLKDLGWGVIEFFFLKKEKKMVVSMRLINVKINKASFENSLTCNKYLCLEKA